MVAAVNKALFDRSWYREGRNKIREEFLGPLDGKATERLAEVILRVASAGAKQWATTHESVANDVK
jgi:hypothetical protein